MPPELTPEHVAQDASAEAESQAPRAARAARLPLEPTGRGVRIAVIDSGVFATHPHIGGVAGGVAIALDGSEHGDFVDRLGHGTAVTAAIKEKAADAEIYAVKVFDRALSTSVATLVHAIEWAARWDIKLVNLSLGTQRAEHEPALAAAVAHAAKYGVIIVAADSDETPEGGRVRWLPGQPAWRDLGDCRLGLSARDVPRRRGGAERRPHDLRASPYPRPVPGVPPARESEGLSFAVANMTGFVARVLESAPAATIDDVRRLLREQAAR